MANYFPHAFKHRPNCSRRYQTSYPSITRFRTSFSSSPCRKSHYLDDSDEDILNEEILETIPLDHYPTLIERWGDASKIHRRYEGDLIIEDYVEFEEIEPTITEEISYEVIYQNNQIHSTREIHRTQTESRNFRRIQKRRTKRKRSQQYSSTSHFNDSSNENYSSLTTTIHANLPTFINSIPLANSDLIEQDISSENFQLIEQPINQSPISANDDGARISTAINDKHIQMSEEDISSQSIDFQSSNQSQLKINEKETLNDETNERLQTISFPITITKTSDEETSLNQQTDSIESQSNENAFLNETRTTTDVKQQEAMVTSIQTKEEDEYVELSSDFLVDNFRQIANMATTNHLPVVDQTSEDIQQSDELNQSQEQTIAEHLLSNTPSILPSEQQQQPSYSIISNVNSHLPVPWKTSWEESIDTVQIPDSEFTQLLEDRYLPSTIDEQTQSDENKTSIPNFTQLYYELHEQRHLQPVLDQSAIESKEDLSTNQQGHWNIDLFSMITNLPSREYRQVFGVSDDVIDTMNDLTLSVEQTLPVIHSNNSTTVKEISVDYSTKKENVHPEVTTTNAELDLRYSVLLDRMNTLLKPLMDLSSTSTTTETRPTSSNAKIESSSLISTEDNQRNKSVDQNELSTSISLEEETMNNHEKQQEITDHIKSFVTTVVSTFTNALTGSESTAETKTSIESIPTEPAVQTPLVANDEPVTQKVGNQQESSTLLSTVSTEDNSNIKDKQQGQDTLAESLDSINLTSTQAIDSISLQATNTNEVESHTILDLVGNALSHVKETIFKLTNTDDKINESKDVSNNFDDHSQRSITEASTKEQTIQTSAHFITTNQDEAVLSQFKQLSTSDRPSIIDHEQADDIEKAPSRQQLQVLNDDYPWYTSHYSIVDAEARFAQFHQQFNLHSEPFLPLTAAQSANSSSANVTTQKKELDDDNDGFQVVQRRKRIPSTTLHEKSTPSNIQTTKTTLSADIDLEPVVLHGNPIASIPHASIVSQTTDSISKRKRKKSKKNDKNEMLFYDAPEPILYTVHSQPVKNEEVQLTSMVDSGDQPLAVAFNDHIDKKLTYQQLQVMQDDYPWYTSHYSIVDAELRFAQFHQQLNLAKTSSPLLTAVEEVNQSPEKVTTQEKVPENEDDQDDTGFQLVQRRKRIPSSTTHDKSTSSIIETAKVPASSDIDLKTIVLHGNPSAVLSHVPIVSQTTDATAKRKSKKSKNNKKEMILYDAPELIINTAKSQPVKNEEVQLTSVVNVQDQTTEIITGERDTSEKKSSYQELQVIDDDYPWYTTHYSMVDAEARFAQFYQQSNLSNTSSPQLANVETVDQLPEKVVTEEKDPDNEHDQDDSGFQLVQRRKRIPSSTLHEKSTSSIVEVPKAPVSSDIDLTPIVLHGNPSALLPHASIVSQPIDTNPKKKHKKSNKKEIILYDAPEPITNITQSQPAKDKEEQLTSILVSTDQKAEVVIDEIWPTQVDDRKEKSSYQQLQVIADDYPWYSSYYSIVDAEARFAKFHQQSNRLSEPLSLLSNVETVNEASKKATKEKKESDDEDVQDDNGFQLVQRRKRIPSSTLHDKSTLSNIDSAKTPVSSDIDLTPIVLHGNPSAPLPHMPVTIQTTDTIPKRKRKKSKKNDKKDMLLYDPPETMLTTAHSQPAKDEEARVTSFVSAEDEKTEPIQVDSQNDEKSNDQELPIIYDNIPSHMSSSSTADDKLQSAQSHQQLTLFSEALPLPANAETMNEASKKPSEEKKESDDQDVQDDDGFQVVQRRKRIPSSTLHDKSTLSNIDTAKTPVSSDIDLEPIVLHGNPSAPLPHVPVTIQTTDTTPKRKRKKSKKNDKKDMLLYNAPEPILTTTHSQPVKDEEAQLTFIVNAEDRKTEPIQVDSQNDEKSNDQELPIIYDNIPSPTSFPSTADGEVRSAQSQQQSNRSSEPLPLPGNVHSVHESLEKTATSKKESDDEHDQDDSGFQIVQRRKRIPSSTSHEKSSNTETAKIPVSPDIDLTPIVLHGNPSAPIPPIAIVSQTTDTTPKTKRKKSKKRNKKEMIVYDAPELETDTTTSKTIENEQVQLTTTVDSEDQKVETESNEINLIQIDDQKSALSPSIASSLPENISDHPPSDHEQSIENEPIETMKTTATNLIPSSKVEQEEEDNEGFQLVRYHGRILSVTKPEQTSSTTTTASTTVHCNLDEKTSTVHKEPSSSTPKKKDNKHKKQKKEVSSSIEADINVQSAAAPSSTVEVSNEPSQSTLPSTTTMKTFLPKPSVPLDDEDEEDNEGFQVVTYRKRITSAPRSANLPPSPSTKTRYQRHVNRTVDQKRVAFHGRHGSASPSIPHTITDSRTNSHRNVQLNTIQDRRQIPSIQTPPRSASVETPILVPTGANSNIRRAPKNTQPKINQEQQFKDSKPDQSLPLEQLTQQIIEEMPITDQQPSIEQVAVSSAPDVINTNVEQPTSDIDQNDQSSRIPVPQTLILTNTVYTQEPITDTNNIRSSLKMSIESTPLSVEETIDQNASTAILESSKPQITITNDSQNQEDPIQLTAPSINVTEETLKPSNNSTDKIDDRLSTDPVVKSMITTEDEHLKTTTTAKKPTKHRKKKSRPRDKTDDAVVSTSASNTNPHSSSDVLQTDTHIIETTSISSHASTIISEEMNSKLDLFLPEYMRQQINIPQPSSSLPTWSKTNTSDNTSKKKSRLKLLTKDHEAKCLLTNEFDHQTMSNEKSDISQTSALDPESSLQSISSIASTSFDNSSSQSVDNILSRGFYHWLQESQALSQPTENRSNIMHNIVFQSSEATEEDEDDRSWNFSKANQSTYMTGIQANKQIHLINAYSINHPDSISVPSWLIRQSHDKIFSDKLDTFDSGHEDESLTDESKRSTDTPSDSNHQFHRSTTNKFVQHKPLHFDDWAHFFPDKTNYSFGNHLSRPLEYFYTQTIDDDTLLSNAIPNEHSIKSKQRQQQQRYGDFHSSTNNRSNSSNRLCSQIKPSTYFQKSRFNFSNQTDDDELLISHSSNGLSRRVGP